MHGIAQIGGSMSFYRTEILADIHDVDYTGVARTSAIMRYIQTSAQMQLTENGLSYEELRRRSRAFILSKIRLEILNNNKIYGSKKTRFNQFD